MVFKLAEDEMKHVVLKSSALHTHNFVEENHKSFFDLLFGQEHSLTKCEWISDTIILLHMILKSLIEHIEVLEPREVNIKSNEGVGNLLHFKTEFFIWHVETD